MNLRTVWPFIEIAGIVLILGLFLVRARRATPQQPRPATFAERLRGAAFRVLRLFGFFAGALVVIFLFLSIERTIFTALADLEPSPSEVSIPANLEFNVEEITFESEDGLTIAGWYVPPKNGAVILLLHGYGGNRISTLWYARQLVPAGYGVLMYDERASGESEGTHRSYGWEDPRDVDAALTFLASRPDPKRVAILGCSTGADIALQSAASFPELAAVWADGASSVRAQDLPKPSNPLLALIIASNYAIDWYYTLRLDLAPPSLTESLPAIAPRPIMLVGGGTPNPLLGSEAEMFTLRHAAAAGPNAEAWIIPEAHHCDGPRTRADEYAQKMVAFFDAAFGMER